MIAAVAASLVLAACGSDGESTTSESAASSTDAAAKATGVEPASIDEALKFSGGKPGKADPSLPAVKVGFTNQQGGSPSFEEHGRTADVAVKFINEHLGGIDGHPVVLEKCTINAEEDGQKCGTQFLNAKLQIASQGLTVVGNQSFFKTVGGKFPIIVAGQGGGPDVSTKHVYVFDGTGVQSIGGLADIAEKLGTKSVAVVASDNPAGKFAIEQLLTPTLDKAGITSKTVFVPDAGTTPDYVSALQAAGANSADAVLLIPAGVGACVSAFDGLKQLGNTKKVITLHTCYQDPFPEHAGDARSNWYISGVVTNPRIAADPQAIAWRNVMQAYGAEEWAFAGFGSKTFQDLLLIKRFGDEVGFENFKAKALEAQIQDYKGPGFLVPGTLQCDGSTPGAIGACGNEAAWSTFSDGEYVDFK